MTPDAQNEANGLPKPIKAGLLLTAIIAAIVVISGLGVACDAAGRCTERWRLLLTAPANEVGDTLSGIGSVLAFIWLVMTAWMQSMELREQRKELRAQRDEWAKMSKALDAQARIFEDERRSRSEQESDKQLEALLERVVDLSDRGPFFSVKDDFEERDILLFGGKKSNLPIRAALTSVLDSILSYEIRKSEASDREQVTEYAGPINQADTAEMYSVLTRINQLQIYLSAAEAIRLPFDRIELALAKLDRLAPEANPRTWFKG